MNRRQFLFSMASAPAALGLGGCLARSPAGLSRRPNILFIMSDDHACATIGAYAGQFGLTPNIDRIAAEGAVLRQNFVTNSICSPSRATILTGLHSHLNGVTHNGAEWDGTQTTFTRILADSGYATALIGKWHQRPPTPDREVDHWDVLIGHGGQGSYHDPHFATRDGEYAVRGYCTDIVGDKAIQWLREGRPADRPFCLLAQFKAPHVPRRPPERHFNTPAPERIPIPATFFDDYANRNPHAATAWMRVWNGRPPTKASFPLPADGAERSTRGALGSKEQAWRRYEDARNATFHQMLDAGDFANSRDFAIYRYRRVMQDYLGCVAAVDDNVGRLLRTLEDLDLADDTVVIYCSDQSYFVGEHGWMEKRWMYEESLRMPFVARWPGRIRPGTRVEALTQNLDVAPTCLALAGIPPPDSMQGLSLLPLLRGEPAPEWRDTIYYHYYHHGAHNVPRHDGVRTRRHKLIHYYTDDVYELFDLQQDPEEMRSVAEDPAYAAVRRELLERLEALRRHYRVPEHVYQHPYVVLSRAERRRRRTDGQ